MPLINLQRHLCLSAVLACVGCMVPPVFDPSPEPGAMPAATPVADDASLPMPRQRTGCLPFPGLMTLFAVADPSDLGVHRYGSERHAPGPDETERGIIYTTRAGFLDLAHLRLTIDYTRYCVAHLSDALRSHATTVAFNGSNGSLFHLALHYPPDWNALPPAVRQHLVNELSLRGGERLAYLMQTWHETASWFGDHTFVFDESPSAFTWDDVMSHAVGVRIAETALRDPSRPFDEAVTTSLAEMLRELGAVGPEQTRQAVEAVDGVWWVHGQPLKRQLDIGLRSGFVEPWIVPGLAFAGDVTPQPFAVPNLNKVDGRDWSDLITARIEPRCAAAERMRAALPALPAWFDVDTDLPAIMRLMRTQMREQYGPALSVPWTNGTPVTPTR